MSKIQVGLCLAFAASYLAANAAEEKEVKNPLGLKPPAYSIAPSVRHAEKRKARAVQWFHRKLGNSAIK
jgi:hypothetical protein